MIQWLIPAIIVALGIIMLLVWKYKKGKIKPMKPEIWIAIGAVFLIIGIASKLIYESIAVFWFIGAVYIVVGIVRKFLIKGDLTEKQQSLIQMLLIAAVILAIIVFIIFVELLN